MIFLFVLGFQSVLSEKRLKSTKTKSSNEQSSSFSLEPKKLFDSMEVEEEIHKGDCKLSYTINFSKPVRNFSHSESTSIKGLLVFQNSVLAALSSNYCGEGIGFL